MDDQRREILSDLLLEWEDQFKQGQDIPAAELAREFPELVEDLAQRIVAMKATSWLEDPLTGSSPASDPPHEESARRTLAGRYRLDELIALGGFAEVWRAYDKELQRAVAIKIPKAGRGESSDDFMAEARRVARLRHSGIVPVYDVGREADQAFIVSEFMDGGSLASRLAKKSVCSDIVVRWVGEIADALEYAHINGVIHRDIKPANILLNHHDEALLGDFGIAQSANKSGRFDPSLGTLFYMSPEQLEGRPVTPASDIYGLAVVLYEALTGEMPYSSSEPNTVRREITTGRKKAWPTKLPKQLVPLITKALSRNPQQRHTSAAHFATDLRRAWNGSSGRIRWLPWTASVLIVGLGAAAALIGARQATQSDSITMPQPPVDSSVRDDLKEIVGSVDQLTGSIVQQKKREEDAGKAAAYLKALEAKKFLDEGKYKAALDPVREAIRLDGSNSQYRQYLGACYFNMKDYERALYAFDQAIQLDSGNPTYHLHRAYSLSLLGRQDEALEAFKAAGSTVESEIPKKIE